MSGTQLKTFDELINDGSIIMRGEYIVGLHNRGIIRDEAIRLIKNLQSSKTIYPLIMEAFPNDSKGECAKDLWNDTKFKYGSEYGMIAVLIYFFNITNEELK